MAKRKHEKRPGLYKIVGTELLQLGGIGESTVPPSANNVPYTPVMQRILRRKASLSTILNCVQHLRESTMLRMQPCLAALQRSQEKRNVSNH